VASESRFTNLVVRMMTQTKWSRLPSAASSAALSAKRGSEAGPENGYSPLLVRDLRQPTLPSARPLVASGEVPVAEQAAVDRRWDRGCTVRCIVFLDVVATEMARSAVPPILGWFLNVAGSGRTHRRQFVSRCKACRSHRPTHRTARGHTGQPWTRQIFLSAGNSLGIHGFNGIRSAKQGKSEICKP
jgi:hypothetical protein